MNALIEKLESLGFYYIADCIKAGNTTLEDFDHYLSDVHRARLECTIEEFSTSEHIEALETVILISKEVKK